MILVGEQRSCMLHYSKKKEEKNKNKQKFLNKILFGGKIYISKYMQ